MRRTMSNHRLRYFTAPDPELGATPVGGATAKAEPSASQPAPDEFKSEHSKATVLADLAKERDARQALEADLNGFKTALTTAFGIKTDSADDDTALLSKLQEQVTQMQQESAVLRLANEHGITDKDDLALLGSVTDADARGRLAERLAAKGDESPASGTPKPDLTQGGKGEPAPRESLPGVPRLAQAFDDEMSNH